MQEGIRLPFLKVLVLKHSFAVALLLSIFNLTEEVVVSLFISGIVFVVLVLAFAGRIRGFISGVVEFVIEVILGVGTTDQTWD